MKQTTLVYCLKGNQVLLAKKKRGVGAGKWNAPGGKVESGETVEAAAIRECQEEVLVTPLDLEKVADIAFSMPSIQLNNQVIAYISRNWSGVPTETAEMQPMWFDVDKIPYHEMWGSDHHWLSRILSGEKIAGSFELDEKEEAITLDLRTVKNWE